MGKASSMSDNTEWDLEETILQVKQNVPIDLRTIARETTNDKKKLLKLWLAQKTKIYRKRQNTGPIQRTRKTFIKSISRRFLRRESYYLKLYDVR